MAAPGLVSGVVIGSTDLDSPWAVQLTTGQRCIAGQGSHDSYEGRVIDYSCDGPAGLALLRGIDRNGATWTATAVAGSSGGRSKSTVSVSVAWFAGPAPSGAVGKCLDLAVSAGAGGAAAGNVSVPLLFRNAGTVTCILSGYPGVAALDRSGRQVAQADRTPSGYSGGLTPGQTVPPAVRLAPGQSASALVEGSDVPVGAATSCPSYASLLVTPPDLTISVPVSRALPGCSAIEVHPVVPGTAGRQS